MSLGEAGRGAVTAEMGNGELSLTRRPSGLATAHQPGEAGLQAPRDRSQRLRHGVRSMNLQPWQLLAGQPSASDTSPLAHSHRAVRKARKDDTHTGPGRESARERAAPHYSKSALAPLLTRNPEEKSPKIPKSQLAGGRPVLCCRNSSAPLHGARPAGDQKTIGLSVSLGSSSCGRTLREAKGFVLRNISHQMQCPDLLAENRLHVVPDTLVSLCC